MKTGLHTLYLRHEPTTDEVWPQYGDGQTKYDVRAYYDRRCTRLAGIFPWHYTSSKPRRKQKTMMLNCWRWRVVWLPAVPPAVKEREP